MILLLGGTSETATLAEALAEAGYRVLVSTATDIPLFVGAHPNIEHRRGRLDATAMAALVCERNVRAIVDATHPFASEARRTAVSVAKETKIPHLTFMRDGGVTAEGGVEIVSNHEGAACVACRGGKPVLLTVGSKNLAVYASEARRMGVRLIARVLEHADSRRAAHEAGIAESELVTGRGPFSVEENRELIRRFGIGVLVTKDSGEAGGVREKLEAARQEGCHVVVVARPQAATDGVVGSAAELVREVSRRWCGV